MAAAQTAGTAAGIPSAEERSLCCCSRSAFLQGRRGRISAFWASFAREPELVSVGQLVERCRCWRYLSSWG